MAMRNRNIKNAGYLLVLLPQLLFVIGILFGFPWLAVLFFFVVLPVMRLYVGNDESPPNTVPSPLLLMYLHTVPRLYFVIWAVLLPWTMWLLSSRPFTSYEYAWIGASFWIVASLNTVVAHELSHTSTRLDRSLGVLLDATSGYFHFMEEHASHHARTGHFVGGDAAEPGLSVYRYAAMRYMRSFVDAWEYESGRLKRLGSSWVSNRLLRRALVPVAVAVGFAYCVGWKGLVFYAAEIVGVAFTVQSITYLQHWGLSQRFTPEVQDFGFAWEDDCWMQACVTLNHAYHGQHHLNLRQPFYKLALPKGALTLPASYPVMFVLALFPLAFNMVMASRLRKWLTSVQAREKMMHDPDCIGAARITRLMRKG